MPGLIAATPSAIPAAVPATASGNDSRAAKPLPATEPEPEALCYLEMLNASVTKYERIRYFVAFGAYCCDRRVTFTFGADFHRGCTIGL